MKKEIPTLAKLVEGARILATGGLRPWYSWLKDQRGQMATIMTLVSGGITLILGVIIFANVVENVPAVTNTTANACINSTSAIIYSSFDLVVIGFIVLAAVFILSIVQRLR